MQILRRFFAVFLMGLLTLSPLGSSVAAKASLAEETGINGYLEVYNWDQDWQKLGQLPFGMSLSKQDLAVAIPSASSAGTRIMLVPVGGGTAHLDAAFLGSAAPRLVGGETGLNKEKLAGTDMDIITIPATGIILDYDKVTGSQTLSLAARIESKEISQIPFYFPLTNAYGPINDQADFYSYTLDSHPGLVKVDGSLAEVQGQEAFFTEYVVPGSGHPAGYIYGWVMNDAENLYAVLDTTPDNTLDSQLDYAAVYVRSAQGVKEFRVNSALTKWGRGDFTYTDKVGYQHKVYEFAIPLREAGLESAGQVTRLELAFAAYGTMAQLPPVEFLPAAHYQVYGQPYSAAAGDFNGDGKIDIVAVDGNNSKICFLEGKGDGTFKEQVLHPVGYAPNDIAAGDFNGDGIDDLAVVMNGGVAIILGNAAIETPDGLPQPTYYGAGTSPAAITSADFNEDDEADLVVTNTHSEDITILLGNGDGTFTSKGNLQVLAEPYQPVAGDFTGDGHLDIAMTACEKPWGGPDFYCVKLLTGDGTGDFTVGQGFAAGPYPSGITAGYFYDSDNSLDLVVATWFSRNIDFTEDDYVVTFRNDGAGSFTQVNTYLTGKGPVSATTGDYNNDGLDDFATCNRYDSNITVYPGYGYTFAGSEEFAVGDSPFSLITADVNDDGKDDIITVNYGDVTVSVLINGTDPGQPEDTEEPSWPAGSELTYSSLNPTGATLEWPEADDDSGSIAKYRIYDGDDLLQEVEGDVTTFTLSSLTPGTDYTIRIEAVDAAGNESADGPSASFTTPATEDTEAPTWPQGALLTCSGITFTGATLEWPEADDDSGAIAKYRIYNGNQLLQEVEGDLTTFTLTNLMPGTDYTLRVEAVDAANNESSGGPTASCSTPASDDLQSPTWPEDSKLTYSGLSRTGVMLEWPEADDNSGAIAKYRIYNGNQLLQEVAGDLTSFALNGLTPGTDYNLRIEAVDESGNQSSDGPSVSFTTPSRPRSGGSRPVALKPGMLEFSTTTYTADEDSGSAVIEVKRTNGSDGSVSVQYTAVDGTATGGLDYIATNGVLTFASGEKVKTFTIPIISDMVAEGQETVNLVLSSPTDGAILGTNNTAVLAIVNKGTIIQLFIGKLEAKVDGKIVSLDAAPFIESKSGRTMVPLRFVSEALAAQVQWLPTTRQVVISQNGRNIIMQIGTAQASIDGKFVTLDCSPAVIDPGRTFVPLRFVSENLGASVEYNAADQSILIIK